MSDPVYDKYIASMRACIDSYGAQNAIYALEQAFELESQDNTHQEIQRHYLKSVSERIGKLYYELEEL